MLGKTYDDLVKCNLEPLVVQGLLRKWAKLKLSWSGCVTAVKMKVLPIFLFLFQSVIIDIPQKIIMNI